MIRKKLLFYLAFVCSITANAMAEGLIFDVNKVKVGDNLGSMKISSIEPLISNWPIGPENCAIKFSGETKISGMYVKGSTGVFVAIASIDILVAKSDKYRPDASSRTKLPVLNKDNMDKYFSLLISTHGINVPMNQKTTIIIDNYKIVGSPTGSMYSSNVIRRIH